MHNVLVYGNGKSRLEFDVTRQFKNIITWGCNKIHHETKVDNLVAVDYLAQQEIYKSGYAKENTCWFLDWNILPKEFTDKPVFGSRHLELLKLGFIEDEIFETDKGSRTRCVVQGKNPKTAVQKYGNLLTTEMSEDEDKQLRHKCMRNAGLYITWLDSKDKVKNIKEFKGKSSGNTAIYLACTQGAKNVYMLGFDLSTENKPYSNVYQLEDYRNGFDSTTWQNQMKTVMRQFKQVKFYWVSPQEHKSNFSGIDNLEFVTINNLNKWIEEVDYGRL